MAVNTIKELIEQQSLLNKTFLIDPIKGEVLDYEDLMGRILKFQKTLQALNLQKGNKVAIALKNSIEAAVCILGVMYSGGVVVPVNLGWKEKEFLYILDNSESSFLISTDEVLEDAGVFLNDRQKVTLGDISVIRLQEQNTCDKNPLTGNDQALMLYTSGTTGFPKGVMLTHRNLIAETGYIQQGHKLTEKDRSLQVLPLFHINGLVIGFLTPFATGATLVIPPKFSVSHFWEWVEQYEITWVSAVPTIISMILSRTPEEYPGAASLKFMRSASAPLPVAVLNEFEERFHTPVVESFGISEGASQITVNPIDGPRKHGSAGRAAGNVVEVVNEQGKLLPTGEIGEVRVKGDNIFCGYYHMPEETEKSLKDGWFYTGDLGWMDEDGYLFLKGRKKELINRAGEKFSPREIDEVLYQIPGIELAAAVGVPDPLYNEEVVAFVKLREGSSLTEQAIVNLCKGKIADFKLPKEIFFTDDFPKGPSGKIQRLKLIQRYEALKNK